jgi:hypothetical protein
MRSSRSSAGFARSYEIGDAGPNPSRRVSSHSTISEIKVDQQDVGFVEFFIGVIMHFLFQVSQLSPIHLISEPLLELDEHCLVFVEGNFNLFERLVEKRFANLKLNADEV